MSRQTTKLTAARATYPQLNTPWLTTWHRLQEKEK